MVPQGALDRVEHPEIQGKFRPGASRTRPRATDPTVVWLSDPWRTMILRCRKPKPEVHFQKHPSCFRLPHKILLSNGVECHSPPLGSPRSFRSVFRNRTLIHRNRVTRILVDLARSELRTHRSSSVKMKRKKKNRSEKRYETTPTKLIRSFAVNLATCPRRKKTDICLYPSISGVVGMP